MSCTEIYAFGKDGTLRAEAEISNAWRGAMQVWCTLEERYLPSLPKPSWIMTKKDEMPYYYRSHQMYKMEFMKEVWGLADSPKLTEAEHIVLRTTFDTCLVEADETYRLIDAFRAFGGEHNSLLEQAEAIERLLQEGDTAIGFNQTSVNRNPWMKYDEKDNEYSYNCLTGDSHFWLFKDLKEIVEEGKA